jgi:sporulation protein YlmC with PRC-barrel domain
MLRSLKDLERYTVSATDGELGTVENFLLDDERWVVRYLVVAAGGLLDGRRVLISPISFRNADWSSRRFHLALTVAKIESSPGVDVDKPVSRQHEAKYYRHYDYPSYWGGSGVWGMGTYPGTLLSSDPSGRIEARFQADAVKGETNPSGDVHLRSAREVCGYQVLGSDEAVGRVADFIIDDETWEVRYLVVKTGHWWSGKEVLVAPHWARRVSWEDRTVHVDLTRHAIKGSPAWDASEAVNRQYESHLYDYYGRPVYWAA